MLLPLVGILACGNEGGEVNPETYFAETEALYEKSDSLSKADLAFVTNPEVSAFGKNWGGIVAYLGDKPAIVRLVDNEGNKWHFLLDSTATKVLYVKQEGASSLNRVAYRGDSVAMALSVNDMVQLESGDPKASSSALSSLVGGLITAIRAERSDLDANANKARLERAQFIVYGKDDTWVMVVNPSTRQVVLTETGKEPRRFAYGSPSQNADGASIYAFNSTSGSLNATLTTQKCEYKGRNLPYTLTIKDGGRTLSGCGLLLQ